MEYTSNLSVKCRPGTNPDIKGKVYFSYHPNDIKNYNHISNMILNMQDCAIYHYDYSKGDLSKEDLHDLLRNMQLFVVYISEDYLNDNIFACSYEFEYAIKNHIPVLPLLTSESLLTSFNQRYGERQCLIETVVDDTKVPFQDKLNTFLSSVLLSDETIRRIRSAFSGQIFLSYRKKDRKKLNEFMKLIHGDKRCRDISFWYDEYLTPGECFSQEIEEKLRESDLFILLATKNIYEKNNYVLKKEYPYATSYKKPVIAVEYENTDRELLLATYDGLFDIFKITDQAEIQTAIIEKLGITDYHKNDPEHLYLIGLAYHSGTGVERNQQLGINLIEQAAKKSFPEAMSKIAKIYHIGDGTDRDIGKAIACQTNYVELLKEIYDKTKTREAAINLYYQRELLATYCREASLNDIAALYCEENVVLEPEIEKMENNATIALFSRLPGLWQRGLVYDRQGQKEKAEECVLQAIRILDGLDEEEKNNNASILAPGYGNAGACFLNHGKLEAAAHFFHQSLKYMLLLKNPEHKGLINTYLSLGHIYSNQSCSLYDYSKAEQYYLEAFKLSESIRKNDPEWGDYSFEPYYHLVYFYDFHNQLEKAEKYILSSIYACKQIYHDNPQKSNSVAATVLYNTATVYAKYNYPKVAEKCFILAEKQCENNVMMNPGWNMPVSILRTIRLGISRFYHSEGNERLAAQYIFKSMNNSITANIPEKESEETFTLHDFSLPAIFVDIADSFTKNHAFLSAEKYYAKGLGLYRMIHSLQLENSEHELAKVEDKMTAFYEVNSQNE